MDNKPQFISTFIEKYRNLPCLWKLKDECYHNKRLKDAAYNELVDYYKTATPCATVDTVKRKINNLKSAFRKELKKVKAEDDYSPSLWYFDLLMFTADQELPRVRTATTSDSNLEEVYQNDVIYKDEPPSPCSIPSPIAMLTSAPGSPIETKTKTKYSRGKRKNLLMNKEDDEFDGIGLNVACKLRRMDEEQRMYAELLINRVVVYGVAHRLQDETDLAGVAHK